MNKFSTDQENFISDYKFFKAKIKNIDLDIEENYNSIEEVKGLEELKQKYIKKINVIDLFLSSLTETDRRIVVLKYIEGKRIDYIANELNFSEVWISKKTAKIRRLMENLSTE